MASVIVLSRPSLKRRLAGWIIGGLPALFLVLDGAMKLVPPKMVVDMTTQLGYPAEVITPLGITLLISSLMYLNPRTSVLGAILLTGYLGGAVNTHVRVSDGWFAILFPALFGALLWLGLVLRDPRLAAVLPWRTPLQHSLPASPEK